jgi:predicted DsbA family dithiol-disulfide isomerase
VTTTGTLEVYADIWCPFAHVGLRAAVATRALFGRTEVPLVIRAWPLELVNGSPMDPPTTAAHIRDLRAQVAPDLFGGFDEDSFPATTLPALALAAAAYRSSFATGEAVSFALRDALFEHGSDISQPTVLDEIAATYGLDARSRTDEDAVREDWNVGRERGVKGSPHFFCRDKEAFCPTLDIERDANGHLILKRNTDQLNAFLNGCFNA